MNKNILTPLIIIAAAIIIVAGYLALRKPAVDVTSFEECAAQGYQILESYPKQCKTPDGKTFTEDIGNSLEKRDLIVLTSPKPNDVVSSPLELTGEARGNWFFEASFPVIIKDANGKELGRIPAQALGEWMTTNFVPFKAILEFEKPATKTGTLTLKKDNPSGLPQFDDELHIPVKFSIGQ